MLCWIGERETPFILWSMPYWTYKIFALHASGTVGPPEDVIGLTEEVLPNESDVTTITDGEGMACY